MANYTFNLNDPTLQAKLNNDPKMAAEFKRRIANYIKSLNKNDRAKVMEAFNDSLARMCDILIDIIKVEKGLQTKPTTNVTKWRKNGEYLIGFYNGSKENDYVPVSACLVTEASRNYINEQLGFEIEVVNYTDKDGFEGKAIIL